MNLWKSPSDRPLERKEFRVIGKETRFVSVLNKAENFAKLEEFLLSSKNLPFDKSKVKTVISKNEGNIFRFKVVDAFLEFKTLNRASFYEKRQIVLFMGVIDGREPLDKERMTSSSANNKKKTLSSSAVKVFIGGRER